MNDHHHVSARPQSHWTCEQVREELDGWSLGALEPAEMRAVERHLSVCAACRSESNEIQDVASLLPFSLSPMRPSSEAKRRLMQRIAEDQMSSAGLGDTSPALPDAAAAPEPPRQRPMYHWSQLLVAPLAIALVVMTLWSFELKGQVDGHDGGTATTTALTAFLPDGFEAYSMHSECEKCQSTGKLLADPEKADALMVAWDLDPSQVHQVWCEEGDGSRVLVASLQVSEDGGVVQPLVFDQPISGYSRIYVISRNGDKVEIKMGMSGTELVPSSPGGTERS